MSRAEELFTTYKVPPPTAHEELPMSQEDPFTSQSEKIFTTHYETPPSSQKEPSTSEDSNALRSHHEAPLTSHEIPPPTSLGQCATSQLEPFSSQHRTMMLQEKPPTAPKEAVTSQHGIFMSQQAPQTVSQQHVHGGKGSPEYFSAEDEFVWGGGVTMRGGVES